MREISLFPLRDVYASGLYYPNVTLISNPIREQIMSLPNDIKFDIESRPVFFFVYNLDNYYHFVYDTLPYLISYLHLKETISDLKLLVNFANNQQTKLNKFVLEFLDLLDIHESDLIFLRQDTIYQTLYFSSSFTHDGKSNEPPHELIYSFYEAIAKTVNLDATNLPKKIYISRRSHKHGKYDNIGTNYTTRRCLVNEDELVHLLEQHGYTEIFTELLSTKEKIALFKNCTHVIGPIGGGLCNVLFSRPNTQLTAIVSPYFLDINSRFSYSFANVKTTYFKQTNHVETFQYKKYMRVRIPSLNCIGEISDIQDGKLCVLYSNETVAGWNAQTEYNSIWVSENEVEMIDPGLNSAWIMNLDKFREEILNA